jgi:LDH2 family malate/lactate/ureidoglycolate dehydrogenase
MILVPASELREVATRIFRAAGADPEPTRILVDHLIGANLAGHDSHGVQHIPGYVKGIQKGDIKPNATPRVVRETPASALIDGGWTFGQVSALYGTEVAIAKAKQNGVAAVGVVRCTHIGRLGTYPTRASQENVVLMVTIGDLLGLTAPFGGAKGVFGTNPFAFGFPADEENDVMIDFATSNIAAGKVAVAKAKHEPVPPGSLIDKDGYPTNDPNALQEGGVLLPFGGHKGSGLALLAALLSQHLVPAGDYAAGRKQSGTFIWAVDAGLFREAEAVAKETDAVVAQVRAVPPAPGFAKVLTPGEPEVLAAERRAREGIPIPEDTWAAIDQTARELGVELR